MSEAAGSKPYSEDEAYLYETYVTEDGIEVPPPTKVMGPRRLARYREEVAEYLRANRRGERAKPVENMGSVVNTDAIDPQVLAVQRRFAALAAQGKIETEANDEEKLHEPAPLTSSLRILRPDEIEKNRVDATSPATVDNPLTSSIPIVTVVKEDPDPPKNKYLVRDEPKVEQREKPASPAKVSKNAPRNAASKNTGSKNASRNTVSKNAPRNAASKNAASKNAPRNAAKPAVAEAASVASAEAASNRPDRVNAKDAQGLDLSVLDGAASGDTVDSVEGDPTVALNPDEVEELLQRMVDRQDPEDEPAPAAYAGGRKSPVKKSAVRKSPARGIEKPVASAERAEKSNVQRRPPAQRASQRHPATRQNEVVKPAQKPSLAWLWIVLLLALVVVGLIMIFGPK